MGSSCSGLLDRDIAGEGEKGERGGALSCAQAPLERSWAELALGHSHIPDCKSCDSTPVRAETILGPLPCGTCSAAVPSRESACVDQRAEEIEATKVDPDDRSDVIIGVPGDPSKDTQDGKPASTGVVAAKSRIEDDTLFTDVPLAPRDHMSTSMESSASGTASRRSSRGRMWRSAKSGTGGEETKKAGRMRSLMSGRRWTKQEVAEPPRTSASAVPRPRNYINSNMPQDYKWLESVLETIALNRAGTLGCKDLSNGKGFVPVFFVLGACPNIFCGMQAVMYSVGSDGDVDFWWVKPGKSDSSSGPVGVEENTLSRHAKGPYKNDPGRSKPFYKPLADLFRQEQVVGDLRFGIEKGGSGSRSRAFLEQASGGQSTRQYMHLVWQEDWTSNPFSRSKYIKGKIVYQKDPEALTFHSREYVILNGAITVSAEEEPPFSSVLPGEEIKDLKGD